MSGTSFSRSVVVVSGAASGIGRQLALQAAQRGASVVASDIDLAGLQETKQMGAGLGLDLDIHQLDVADREAVFRFADKIIPGLQNKRLVLINNAGVGLFTGSFEYTELDDFEWLLNINLWGAIYMTKAFYAYLLERNEGHIVNLSSVFGLAGVKNQSAYCTSKFALRGFTETLRMELMGTGINTTSVHPGGVNTDIARRALPKGAVATAEMHRNTVKSFERAAITSPEKAASLILNAVEKKKQRLVIGRDGKAIDLITRLFPVRYTRLLKQQMEKAFADPFTHKRTK